jgi:large subunit ribosomal protein L25
MKGHGGENPIFLLKLGDKERHAMIRNTQVDPVSRHVIHIDFQRVLLDQKIRVAVPVELVGTAVGVKVEGGMLDFVTREVHVECLPGQIPKHLEVDVTELHVGQHVEARTLQIPEGVVLLEEPDRVIVSLGHGRLEAEETPGERVEPEVIKKTKAEA